MNDQQLRVAGAIAGVVTVVCAALPWATVSTIFGSVSTNGLEGDGLLTAILGAAAGIIAWRAGAKAQLGTLACAALILLIGIYDWVDVSRIAGEVEEAGLARASAGIGLYGTVLAGVALAVIGMLRLRSRPGVTAPAVAPPIT